MLPLPGRRRALRGVVKGLAATAIVGCGTTGGTPVVATTASGAAPTGPAGLKPGSRLNTLWIGNSLTNTPLDYNDYALGPLPARLKPMLAERGVELSFAAAIRGGANFADHIADPETMKRVADPAFDLVNLQGYYQGYDSVRGYLAATAPLYDAARAAGSDVLFEGLWPYLNDPGSPQHPRTAEIVESAAASRPRSFPVQVGRAWHGVLRRNAALHAKLRADNTHQSAVGEYLNCLVYTRFLTATSVADIQSIHPRVSRQLSAAERAELKSVVDETVTIFYRPA